MKKKRTVAFTVAALLMLVSLASCGKSSETTTPAQAEKTTTTAAPAASSTTAPAGSISQDTDIVAGITVDFTTMDPLDTSDTLSGGIQRMIMDGLFGFDDKMNIYPMLASGYTANDTATEFTITLRKGISFTDGTPWDADV
jgi:glutathione transport system substrate-binding protein